MTLTEFLLARIAEDEIRAWAAIEDDRGSDEGFSGKFEEMTRPPSGIGIASGGFGKAAARMIATYAVPARVLAECEAKRRIVEMHPRRQVRTSGAEYADGGCAVCAQKDDAWYGDGWTDEEWPCPTLRALASVYADHSDYRQEWAL